MKARVALIAATLLASAVAFAHPPHDGPPGPDMDRMAVLLDLNDAQKSEVQKILNEQHEKMRAAHGERHSADSTRPTREERAKFHEQMKQDTVARLQSVLSATQIKKFEALMDHPRPHRARSE
jgi:Spy/CpxP family protein refolding chaperone